MINRMMNRATFLLNSIYEQLLIPVLLYTEHLFIGKARKAIFDQENLIQKELIPNAQQAKNGLSVVRVGPPLACSTRHIAVFIPKSKKILKELLDEGIENDASGRSIMDSFETFIGNPSISNKTGHDAMVQLGKIRKFTSDVQGIKKIEKEKFKAIMKSWLGKKDGFILLDEIKLLIRRVAYNRFITEGKELSLEENTQLNAGFSAIKKVLLNPYSLLTQINFLSDSKKYQKHSGKFVTANIDEVNVGLKTQGSNLLSDLVADDIQDKFNVAEIKNTVAKKLNGSMLLMGAMDGIYINLVGILFQLMKNPTIVNTLRKELDNVSISLDNQYTIPDDILLDSTKLPYLMAIIKEGLRFISSAPTLPRYTRGGIHTEHIDIPSHSTILINLETLHFDEKLWGGDAKEFRPERFLEKDAPKLHDFPFMPFSVGKRLCPGINVGLMSLKLFISELYLNYELVAAAGQTEPKVDTTSALVMDIGAGYRVYLQTRDYHYQPEPTARTSLHS